VSPSNVEIARRSYEAFERDDLDAVLADMDDDIVWEQAQGLPHGGVYHGLAEVRRNIFEPLDTEWWAEFHAVPHEFLESDADVVVLGRYTGRAKETGRALDVPYVHVWTFADGRAVRFRQFLDTAGWNAALGRDGTSA
jgi:ketosteroid isomerase-like protein